MDGIRTTCHNRKCMSGPITNAILARADVAFAVRDIATIDHLHGRVLDLTQYDPEAVAIEGELYDLLEYLNILHDLLTNPAVVSMSKEALRQYRKNFDDTQTLHS